MLAASHYGLAGSVVMEPMAMLYRYSGKHEYLDFCNYVLGQLESRGPKIVSGVTNATNIQSVAWKAYELMWNYVGLFEIYRVTGNAQYRTALDKMWNLIYTSHRSITGTAGGGEQFRAPHTIPMDGEGIEGDISNEWIRLCIHIFRLTGDIKYADEAEVGIFNHALCGQDPVSGQYTYFTPLNGTKDYGGFYQWSDANGPVNGVKSTMPRALALYQFVTAGLVNKKPAIVLYSQTDTFYMDVLVGTQTRSIGFKVDGDYPVGSTAHISVMPGADAPFELLLRVPAWCDSFVATVGTQTYTGTAGSFLSVNRLWKQGDIVIVGMAMKIKPEYAADYPTSMGFRRGPLLLATTTGITQASLPEGWRGSAVYSVNGQYMVPFADAGQIRTDGTTNIGRSGTFKSVFDKVAFSTFTATEILSPVYIPTLTAGAAITFLGRGTNLSWNYSTDSLGRNRQSIGSGSQVAFTVPSGKTMVTVYLSGTEGQVARTYRIGTTSTVVDTPKTSIKLLGTPITSVSAPTGSGSKDLETIRDGIYPTSGGYSVGYDTYYGSTHTQDYVGYTFTSTYLFNSLTIQFGVVEAGGGAFASCTVQVLQNGTWVTAAAQQVAPVYNSATVQSYGSYTFTFTPAAGTGIRIIGAPVGGQWVGCAELDVTGSIPTTALRGAGVTHKPAPAVSSLRSLQLLAQQPSIKIQIYAPDGRMITNALSSMRLPRGVYFVEIKESGSVLSRSHLLIR